MALFDEGKGKLLGGIVIGMGVTWVAREFLAPFGQAMRPLAKAGIKSGILAWERGREAAGHLGEALDDLVAEVKAEQAIEDLTAAAPADAGEVE